MVENINAKYDIYGRLITSNIDLNNIIRAVEDETESSLSAVIPAVTFEDNPEEKIYLLLLKIYSNNESEDDIKDWFIKIGRQATYNYLRDLVKNEAIDPNESFVIAGLLEFEDILNKENVSFNSKPVSVFRFMKVMYENKKILDSNEDFDINEFDPRSWEKGDKTILDV